MISCALPFETPKSWRDRWINGQGRCIQGNNTDDTHHGDLAYAFDFKLRPGTKVLAARHGVVAAFCDHFGEGGMKSSLRPRANFVALRHDDGTYTRYVHLMRNGVRVKLEQVVTAGQVIALSGNTGFTSGPHLHFDAVNVLPQETSEVWIVHPMVMPLPSVAAIFSGPLNHDMEDFATAPLIYLSPEALQFFSSHLNGSSRGTSDGRKSDATASLLPLLQGHPEVVVLVDRGGAGGKQTFVEAAATAADAVASVPLSAHQGFPSGEATENRDGGGRRHCRCVGIIVANNQPGHEVFQMAAPTSTNDGEGVRAPFPVVQVSQESGQLLKSTLALSFSSPSTHAPTGARAAPQSGSGFGAQAGRSQGQRSWGEGVSSQSSIQLDGDEIRWGGKDNGGVVVSLGAAEHCPTHSTPAAATGTFLCESNASPAVTCSSSAISVEEDDGDCKGPHSPIAVPAGYGYSWVGSEVGCNGFYSRCYPSNMQPTAGAALKKPRPGNVEAERLEAPWRRAVDENIGEWRDEKSLFRTKTLPVSFERSIW